MASFYLNNYQPLAASLAGRRAVRELALPPFVDGSIRREPDFEHKFPAISCLCRGDRFTPRLKIGDIVAYMTKKGRFGQSESQRRLTAVLKAVEQFGSHEDAAAWYAERCLAVPSNLMISGNNPKPLEQSHCLYREGKSLDAELMHRLWNKSYARRAREHPIVVVCELQAAWLEWNAPLVSNDDLVAVFGDIPGMQNPGEHSLREFQMLMQRLGLHVPLSAP